MSKNYDVDTPTEAYTTMLAHWTLVDALAEGTPGMRKAAKKYLPQEPKESDEAYTRRLNRSVLYNGYGRAVDTVVGKLLMDEVVMSASMPEDVQGWCENIDLEGSDMATFLMRVLDKAVHYGKTHILAEYPVTGSVLTLGQERDMKVRPYLVHLEAPQVIGWRVKWIGYRRVLQQLRFVITAEEDYGDYGTVAVKRVHVLNMEDTGFMSFAVHKSVEGQGQSEWQLEAEGTTTMTEIPLVTIYTNRTGYLTARPAFEDVAHLNVAHWQSASDQRNILHVSRVPILFGRKLGDDLTTQEVGPNHMITAEDDGADLRFVEHSGRAIDAGRQDLTDLKNEMATLAMEVLTKQTGTITATEKAIDTAAASGGVVAMVRALQNGVNEALRYMGQWVKREDVGEVDLNTDFTIMENDSADLDTLVKSRTNGDLSAATFWHELKRRGVLSEDFDPEKEEKELDKESEKDPLPPVVVTDGSEDDGTSGSNQGGQPAGGNVATLGNVSAPVQTGAAQG